jgi:peptidoglycan/xylan/chitin deacetylase (PgdA/CDA1 family)
MFHHFHGRPHPIGQGSISAQQFADLLDFVGLSRILPAEEWQARAVSNRLMPEDVCLTFDDNLMCQFEIAVPVLRQFGLTAFWFVYTSVVEGKIEALEVYRHFRTTQFESVESFYESFFEAIEDSPEASPVGDALSFFVPATYLSAFPFYSDSDRKFRFVRDEVLGPLRYAAIMDRMIAAVDLSNEQLAQGLWMGAAQLRSLHREGHVIGLHSHTHPTRLGRLSRNEQRDEYGRNQSRVAEVVGRAPAAMSHPCNSYNESTLMILRDLGIRVGFRANMQLLTDYIDRGLEHPRQDHANLMKEMAGLAA